MCYAAFAQHGIGLATSYGRVVKHTSKINYNPPPNSFNIEANYIYKTNGNKAWHTSFGNPQVGLTFTYNNYCDTHMGFTLTAMPHIQFALVRYKTTQAFVRLGTGPAYASQYYTRADTAANYLGSKVNMYAQVLLGINYLYKQQWQLQLGYALSHVSNGAIIKPNYGINLFGGYAGINYFVSKPQANTIKHIKPQAKGTWGIDARLAYSRVAYGVLDGPLLPVYYASILAGYTYRNKHKLLIGVDYEYNARTQFFINNTYQPVTNYITQAGYAALVLGNEFLLGQVSIPVQVGWYINNPYLKVKAFYQRFGVLWYPFKYNRGYGNGLYIGTTLKSNGTVADYIDVMMGYRVVIKK
jgi:hypothetical protein